MKENFQRRRDASYLFTKEEWSYETQLRLVSLCSCILNMSFQVGAKNPQRPLKGESEYQT